MTQMNEATQSTYEVIRQTLLDYVEGIYEVDPARIERSVHPSLHKGGFFVQENGTYSFTSMAFSELVELSKHYNEDGKMPKDAPKEIVIYDVLDQIATAKLTAWWGTDYIQLAKYDGRWMIVNILWQTHPTHEDRIADLSQLA